MIGLETRLQEIGLTKNEAKIYLLLLRNNEVSASDLANKADLDRSFTYSILNNLVSKGLAAHIIKTDKKYFSASDPESLLNPIREKESFINDTIKEIKAMSPEEKTSQKIEVYEGKAGLRAIFHGFIKSKEGYFLGATGRSYELLYEAPKIAKLLDEGDNKYYGITQEKNRDHPMTKFKCLNFRYLEIETEATIVIIGNTVLIILAKEKPVLIKIENNLIANTFKNYFKFLWKLAKE